MKSTGNSDLEISGKVDELAGGIEKFTHWLEYSGYSSFDPYDLFGTRYGVWARRLYYKKHPMGIALTAPLILSEVICPRVRSLFIKKDRYATAEAQLCLGFLNLYSLEHDKEPRNGSRVGIIVGGNTAGNWMEKTKELVDHLLSISIPGFNGHCWGYPFDWQSVNGLIPKGTPHITATPYCFEVFLKLYDLTGEDRYLEIAESIAVFVFKDLIDTPVGNDAAASGYFPNDRSKVVNAVAYRAFVLFEASRRFSNEEFLDAAWKNLRFILRSQQLSGAWLYAIDNPREAFIDHFHTCFVLKNLHKLNLHLRNDEVTASIRKGYDYYRRELYDQNDNPKSFAILPRRQIVKLEMYNFAEAISLGVLLRGDIPGAFALAQQLAMNLIKYYQLGSGCFVTRVYHGGIRHTLPFLRWPQAQLFYALTNLLKAQVIDTD